MSWHLIQHRSVPVHGFEGFKCDKEWLLAWARLRLAVSLGLKDQKKIGGLKIHAMAVSNQESGIYRW